MLIKKHYFVYPPIENNKINVGDLNLSSFDEVIIHDILLIVRIGKFYNFYLPSLEDGDRFTGNVFPIFNTIKDFIYEKGLLFIKDEQDGNSGNWIVIEPNQFSWYLSESNLSSRKAVAPKIPYKNVSNLEVLNFKHSHGIFVKVDHLNYFIEYKYSNLELKKLDGNIRDSKIFNSFIIGNQHGESFFRNKKTGCKYSKIREMPHFHEHFLGYLSFCDSSCKLIKALTVGRNEPDKVNFNFSYSVEFENPIKSIKFIRQKNQSTSSDVNIPIFAIHIWLIETHDGEQKYLLQGIGKCQFTSILNKEDFKF